MAMMGAPAFVGRINHPQHAPPADRTGSISTRRRPMSRRTIQQFEEVVVARRPETHSLQFPAVCAQNKLVLDLLEAADPTERDAPEIVIYPDHTRSFYAQAEEVDRWQTT
jgi:hypothetical protein